MSLESVRAVADAVLYEGYLLYPYRASAQKNRTRWQFGVLGPPGAAERGLGEESGMAVQCLLDSADSNLDIHVRFLQLQARQVRRRDADGRLTDVESLDVGERTVLSWDEAVERETVFTGQPVGPDSELLIDFPGGEDVEPVQDGSGVEVGQVVRRRWPVRAHLRLAAERDGAHTRLTVAVENAYDGPLSTKDDATRVSLLGAHLVLRAAGAGFVSVIDPPDDAAAAAAHCVQHRCWPVLAGPPGATDLVLGSPIILYDHPEVAEQSPGALFDATEIDEILVLRIMTMTEAEKAEARATDPQVAAIIDRCDGLTPEELQALHGILRDPLADLRNVEPPSFDTAGAPWWDPAADAAVSPDTDVVVINGVPVGKGSLVRVHPSRRADAQDLFFADQVARVIAVLSDVDGGVHVALVLVDDPAADLHDWYGRYFYFAPDELEPLAGDGIPNEREESRS
ncbi:hypothetical protein Ais01nite_00330 [Asanoa ishikariensis]|uniref:Uncharacterized protein n=1 Tax=Asanoa ishikariensis TaxID=137265 RepID=A0A1H3TQ72_9ACTN|nr:hypothetical protein [Asanoa ishikariensis]GIF61998.1 hypothetical protein Ais01nite_00330 [Asanoa ishikariensis]SDZ52346.1 hypothetical protein SAMN05421684_6190 [Asanoa ishikariensis]